MRPEALVLLHGDPIIQKLCVTWPQLQGHPDGRAAQNATLKYVVELAMRKAQEWSRISGVDEILIRDRVPILFGNGICWHNGTTAQEALEFVSSRMRNESSSRSDSTRQKYK